MHKLMAVMEYEQYLYYSPFVIQITAIYVRMFNVDT